MPPYNEHGCPTSGTTAQRPTNCEIGFLYFDTDLQILVIWNGTAYVAAASSDLVSTQPASGTSSNNSNVIGGANSTPQYTSGFVVVTGATIGGLQGCVLPAVSYVGQTLTIKNTGVGTLKVWPTALVQINANGAGLHYPLATNTIATFYATDTLQWYTVPLLAS